MEQSVDRWRAVRRRASGAGTFVGSGFTGVLSWVRSLGAIIWNDADRLNISLISAGIGFFTTLSLFPALAVLVMVWSLAADPAQINGLLDLGADVMPADVHRLLSDQVSALIATGTDDTLGWATIITGLFAFWSARAGVHSMTRGLDAVYETPSLPGYLRRELVATGLTLTLYLLAAVVAAALFVAPVVLSYLSLGGLAAVVTETLRLVIAVAAVLTALTLIYRYGHNHTALRVAWITPGSVAATVMWLMISIAFSIYLQNFANYNEVYGSIGAVVALLMWVYLSGYAVLLGAALNAKIWRLGTITAT